MSNSTITTVQDQACFRLNDLPYELQFEILKHAADDGWGRMTLLDLACVNSHFTEIAIKLMNEYKFNLVTDVDGHIFQKFIKTMIEDDGRRVSRMRRLDLTTNWHEHVYYAPWARSGVSSADHFGIWAMENMTGLRKLTVAYPRDKVFLNPRLPLKLQTLIVRPTGLPGFQFNGQEQNRVELTGTVDAYFLETALRLESLTTLDLGGQAVINEDILLEAENLPIKTSQIEHLKLTVGNFSDKALLRLLQAPRGLRSFEFTPPTFEDVNYKDAHRQWSSTVSPVGLPLFSTIGTGLTAHAATLESLTLRRCDAHWTQLLTTQLGSLASFHVLKHLDIDCTTLLGWHHCEHLRSRDPNKPKVPSALKTLLPTSLETLTLRFEDYHNTKVGYILELIRELKDARFSNLRAVTFNLWETFHYCQECEDQAPPFHDIPTWRHVLTEAEGQLLRDFAKRESVAFEFTLFDDPH